MKIILFVLAFSMLGTRIGAQTVFLEWAKGGIGGTGSDEAKSIAKDTSGNIYVTGNFLGTVDFDPGPGTANFTSLGGYDIFVIKLDAAGNLLWARRMGGIGGEEGDAVAVDEAENVYITGWFQQTADFDPGTGVANLTSAGGVDIFVVKLDTDGNFGWAKSMAGAGLDSQTGRSITVDAVGNAYVTGIFTETVDFDPGPGTNNLTAAGMQDVFVMKLDTDGNVLWTKQMGGTNLELCQSVALDGMGNLYLTGFFRDTVDFDPGAGVYDMSTIGNGDVFVSKWDTDGDLIWAKQMGGMGSTLGNAIAVDKSGNIHIAGTYEGTADFDPGPGTHNLTSTASFYDIFVLKLDTDGNLLWVEGMGGTINNQAKAIALDDTGNVYVTGLFTGTVDFDADTGIANLASAGGEDIFMLKLDASGLFSWVKRMGNPSGTEQGNAILVDSQNSVYVTGIFWATADIGPGFGAASLTSNGQRDIFLLKLGQCTPVSVVDTQVSCGPYLWMDGNIYSASDYTATHTLPGGTSGCDTTFTLHLTVNPTSDTTLTQTACSEYSLNGQTYTQSGTYTQTLTGAAGCDSTVTLYLTVNQPSASTWVQTACDSYVLNGQTYTATGTYTQNLSNTQGCDSVITLQLTINNVNTSVTQNGIQLQSEASDASYQWIDCTTGQAIAEATAQTYTATANGQYSVAVTHDGCTDTSACLWVGDVGISENDFGGSLKIYPNPTHGKFFVEFAGVEPYMEIVLTSATGQIIGKRIFTETHVAELEINPAQGVYLIRVSDGKGRQTVMRIQKLGRE